MSGRIPKCQQMINDCNTQLDNNDCDLDFICNWLGNQAWSLSLPWNGQKAFNSTKPVDWNVDGKAAGTIRQANGVSNMTFVRVFDAGHMVPMDQPKPALALVNAFISDTLKP